MKFVHTGDLHLDSPLRGLERYEGAPVERVRGASRRAFEGVVELCLREDVDFLLLAGDLLDGSGRDFHTVLFLAGQLARLKEAGIPVFAILGNHDAEHPILRSKPFPDNVTLMSASRAQTVILEKPGVAVHGRSYARRAERENLVAGYPPPVSGLFNIGLLHTALSGREGHEPYAPCRLEDLLASGYHYWALGHVHQRELVRDRDPVILFPGNIQGRHIRETGQKGATLVTVDPSGEITLRHEPLDLLRWRLVSLELTGVATMDQLLEVTQEGLDGAMDRERLTAVRVRFHGSTPLHAALMAMGVELEGRLRLMMLDLGGDILWLERIILDTRPREETQPLPGGVGADALAMIDLIRRQRLEDPESRRHLMEEFTPLRAFLGKALVDQEGGFSFQDESWLEQSLLKAQALVQHRLQQLEPKEG